jgi:hypothetical protein
MFQRNTASIFRVEMRGRNKSWKTSDQSAWIGKGRPSPDGQMQIAGPESDRYSRVREGSAPAKARKTHNPCIFVDGKVCVVFSDRRHRP